MKLCVSTLGCPTWSWDEIVPTVKDFGYNGIEVRGVANELYVPHIKVFSSDNIEKTNAHLKELSLEIACLTSACYLHKNDKDYVTEAKEYMDLAAKLDCPYIRVLGDTDPQPHENVDLNMVAEKLNQLAEYGESINVMPLIETNGALADSAVMLNLLSKINSKNVGVIWDLHHPYRYFGETPDATYGNIGGYIKHIHVKDSMVTDGKIKYVLTGEGDVPIKECLRIMRENGYKGFVCLEWVKRWYEDLTEPGIVFMQFNEYMKSLGES